MILCANCGSRKSKLEDSRYIKKGKKRKRTCLSCGFKYSTIETVLNEKYRKITIDQLKNGMHVRTSKGWHIIGQLDSNDNTFLEDWRFKDTGKTMDIYFTRSRFRILKTPEILDSKVFLFDA